MSRRSPTRASIDGQVMGIMMFKWRLAGIATDIIDALCLAEEFRRTRVKGLADADQG
jgi:hypothetical protein